jgi:hypothetical protein
MQTSLVNLVMMIPKLLNSHFTIHHYDGGVYEGGGVSDVFDISNVLIPTRDSFHCSDAGTRKNLVLKCSSRFILTHIFIQAPRRKCTEPVANSLVWVTDTAPNIEESRYYDGLEIDEIRSKCTQFDPILVSTSRDTLEGEVALTAPYRKGRYVHIKFLDTHSDTQENIDIAVVGLVGFLVTPGMPPLSPRTHPFGPWLRRQVTPPPRLHPHTLSASFSSRGWCCDGRDFSGGCRGRYNDFNETSVYDVTFRCATCGFDLCEYCVAGIDTLGRVTPSSAKFDIEHLSKSSAANRRLAHTRLKNQLRIDPGAFGEYLEAGLIEVFGKLKFSAGGAKDSIALVRTVLARLSDDGPHDWFVTIHGGDVIYETEAYHLDELVPVSNRLDLVAKSAKLFSMCSEWRDLIDSADLTIVNGAGESLMEVALAEDNLEMVEEIKKRLEIDGTSIEIMQLEGLTSPSPSPHITTRTAWQNQLSRILSPILLEILNESLSPDLLSIFEKLDHEPNEQFELLLLKLWTGGNEGEAETGLRMVNRLLKGDHTDFFSRINLSKWVEKIKILFPSSAVICVPPSVPSTPSLCSDLLLTENFPVYKLSDGPKGFTQLTQSISLRINGLSFAVEPLVSLGVLRDFYLMTHPVVSFEYTRFCYELIGSELEGLGRVIGFEIATDLGIGIHKIEKLDGDVVFLVLAALDNFKIAKKTNRMDDDIPLLPRLTYERLLDPEIVNTYREIRDQLLQPGSVIVAPSGGLDRVLPLLGLIESPEGYVVPETGAPGLRLADTCLGGTSTRISSPVTAPSVPASHTTSVSISIDVSDIPFQLVWPMIRGEVFEAIRPYVARSWPGMTMTRLETVFAAGGANGNAVIARGLTVSEAEAIARRIGMVVQATAFEDRAGAEQAERERTAETGDRSPKFELGQKIKFFIDSVPLTGIVVSVTPTHCDVIDCGSKIVHMDVPYKAIGTSTSAGNAMRQRIRDTLRRRLLEMEPGDEESGTSEDPSNDSSNPFIPFEIFDAGGTFSRMLSSTDFFGPGGFVTSMSDFLSVPSEPTETAKHEIPGIHRGHNLNAPVAERFSPDDLQRGVSYLSSPSHATESPMLAAGVRIVGGEWVRDMALPFTTLFPITLTKLSKEYEVEFEIEFVTATQQVVSSSMSNNREIKKRRTSSSDEFMDTSSSVGSPRATLACLESFDAVDSLRRLRETLDRDPRALISDPRFELFKSVLSRKIHAQLDEPLVLISHACGSHSMLPVWVRVLPQSFPELFSEQLRMRIFTYTSLSPALVVYWIQLHRVGELLSRRAQLQSDLNTESSSSDSSPNARRMQQLSQELSNIEERIGRHSWWFGANKTCLARLRKEDKFFEMSEELLRRTSIPNFSSLLEIQFEGETGFGQAVTRSFFAELAKEFLVCDLWIQPDHAGHIPRRGLRLEPRKFHDIAVREKISEKCKSLGRLIAKAVSEGYIVPLPISTELWGMIRDPSAERPIAALPMPGDGCTGEFVGACARGESETILTGAFFLSSGFSGPELIPDGGNVSVTLDNLPEFTKLATRFYLHDGIDMQIASIRAGINEVFPVESLLLFTPDELRTVVGGQDEIAWTEGELRQILHFHDPTFTSDWLVNILLELDNAQRATFLDFVTSCPRMPAGGPASLRIEVFPEHIASSNVTSPVLRPAMPPIDLPPELLNSEPPQLEVVGYPRSRACVNHLYLPRYKSRDTLKERLIEAMISSVHHDEITN